MITSGTVSVDTFFVLSGLLVSYASFKNFKKGEKQPKICKNIFWNYCEHRIVADKPLNLPIFYLHRFLRLTPALAAVIFFQVSLYRHLGNGPIWKKFTRKMIANCEKNWWAALLYIQNHVDVNNMVKTFWFLYFVTF